MTDNMKSSDEMVGEVNEILQKTDFGSELKLVREKKGLSQVDVAENLLISVDIIKALENSQADALPALTFTLGYIRSYTRLLGMPADTIINDYVRVAPDSKQELMPHSALAAQKSSNDIFVKLISFAFVALAILVFIFWFLNTDFKIKSPSLKNTTEFNTQLQNKKIVVDAISEESLEVVEAESPSSSYVDTSAPRVAEVNSKPVIEQRDKNLSKSDVLSLSALADSWCEVLDSNGQRLFYQLLKSGEDIRLTGVAPFTVFLGNAPKVRVEINNKIVDFENLINTNSNIASFEIRKDAAVTRLSDR
jgi:cytoskeleton protein RodZ